MRAPRRRHSQAARALMSDISLKWHSMRTLWFFSLFDVWRAIPFARPRFRTFAEALLGYHVGAGIPQQVNVQAQYSVIKLTCSDTAFCIVSSPSGSRAGGGVVTDPGDGTGLGCEGPGTALNGSPGAEGGESTLGKPTPATKSTGGQVHGL